MPDAEPRETIDCHYSFVVDKRGDLAYQGYLLARSLIAAGGVRPTQITAHLVEGVHPSVEHSFRSLGLATRWVPPFGHPYCNKIQQLPGLTGIASRRVVLLDTDTLVLAPLVFPDGDAIFGKMVDAPNPPLEVLTDIFAEATLRLELHQADVIPGATVRGNFNGGLYVVPVERVDAIHEAWARWARWCIERKERFGRWFVHIDQVAFALAAAELGLLLSELPRRYNTPTHLGPHAAAEAPQMLHYHRHVDPNMMLLPTGDATVDAAIGSANQMIMQWHADGLPNDLFWSARYEVHPELGSGLGSRGEFLESKRQLLRRLVRLLGVRTIVDIGGGDGAVMEGLGGQVDHLATDVAPRAALEYRRRNPGARFTIHDIASAPSPETADLAVCLDVLIHIGDRSEYRDAVANIVASGSVASVVSGYDDDPMWRSPLVYYHEPLLSTITDQDGVSAFPVLAYRGLVVYVVLRNDPAANPRDAPPAMLQRAMPLTSNHSVLLECVVVARRELGFFPSSLSRCLEYPWVLDGIRRLGQRQLRIADVGAGVNVLPVILHDDGHEVVTVDGHSIQRDAAKKSGWTEWGFLDYSSLRNGITSVHGRYEECQSLGLFDVIYSVSVIEHLPAHSRRAWIAQMAAQLQSGGRLFLTVDTEPLSCKLWNFSEGVQVEEPEVHGTLDAVVHELSAAGFKVEEQKLFDWLPMSRVATALIAAERQ